MSKSTIDARRSEHTKRLVDQSEDAETPNDCPQSAAQCQSIYPFIEIGQYSQGCGLIPGSKEFQIQLGELASTK